LGQQHRCVQPKGVRLQLTGTAGCKKGPQNDIARGAD